MNRDTLTDTLDLNSQFRQFRLSQYDNGTKIQIDFEERSPTAQHKREEVYRRRIDTTGPVARVAVC